MSVTAQGWQGQVARFIANLEGVRRYSDTHTFAAYLFSIATNLKVIVQTHGLLPADARMRGRTCRFHPLPGTEIILDGEYFSGAREIYCRRCYFTVAGFEIRPDYQVVDIGANAGLYSVMAAASGARVLAIEAQSEFLPIIEANARRNGCLDRVTTEHALVGSDTGLLASIESRIEASHWSQDAPTKGLAEIFESQELERVDLMKLDIEGSEFSVLSERGALERVDRIVAEVHHGWGDVDALVASLETQDFDVRLVSDPSVTYEEPAGSSSFLFARAPGTEQAPDSN